MGRVLDAGVTLLPGRLRLTDFIWRPGIERNSRTMLLLDLLFLAPLLASTEPPQEADTLRVLVWNIQRGANLFEEGPKKALQVIRDADPDICLLQESYDVEGDRPTLGRWMAGELGWNAWQGESPHLCVLTHLEIQERHFHHPWHGVGARLVDEQGRSLVAYSIWIDWKSYLPYLLRDEPEVSDAELLAAESEGSDRMAQALALLEHLEAGEHVGGGVPLLVGGDWNCPSHLDWTEDTARIFRYRRPLPLPVSLAVAEAGLVDAFRSVHPDPTRRPGNTWTPLERGTVESPTPADRIDRLYVSDPASGPRLVPFAAHVLPLELEPMGVPAAKREFPSDHAAVIVDLRWMRGE